MSSRIRPREEPGLFDDLPLHEEPQTPESLPLFNDSPTQDQAVPPPQPTEPVDAVTRPVWRPIVPINAYLSAGIVDLGVVLAVMLVAWLGLWWLGVDLDLVGRGLVVLFLLPFSFLYQVFPLAFWGSTPGMSRVGIVARNLDGQSLSFSQAARRWLASVLTVISLGLPLILTAVTGRSLADRFSGSLTFPAR